VAGHGTILDLGRSFADGNRIDPAENGTVDAAISAHASRVDLPVP